MIRFKTALIIALFSSVLSTYASDEEVAQETIEHESHGKNSLAVYSGFTHIPNAFYEHETHEQSTGKWVPTLGLDYFRKLNERLSLGAMVDLEFDNYMVKLNDESDIERSNVLVAALVVKYDLYKGLGLMVGPGIETEFSSSNKNFAVLKTGIEYEIEMNHDWFIAPSFVFDFKQEYYTYAYGFTIGKQF